jgi:hypothetical protein
MHQATYSYIQLHLTTSSCIKLHSATSNYQAGPLQVGPPSTRCLFHSLSFQVQQSIKPEPESRTLTQNQGQIASCTSTSAYPEPEVHRYRFTSMVSRIGLRPQSGPYLKSVKAAQVSGGLFYFTQGLCLLFF